MKLLTAAAEEIVSSGYAGASLSQIARRVGLTKGALSRNFPTKTLLIEGVVSEAVDRTRAIIASARREFPSSPERTCVLVVGYVAAVAHEDPVMAAALLTIQDPAIDPSLSEPLRNLFLTEIEALLSESVRTRGQALSMSVADSAQFLVTVLNGLLAGARQPSKDLMRREPLYMAATLRAMGIDDGATVVADIITHLHQGHKRACVINYDST